LLLVGIQVLFWIREGMDTLVSFLTLVEMISGFSPFSIMLAPGLSCIAFIMLKYVPFHRFFRAFVMYGCWILSKVFYCMDWNNHMVFVLDSVYVLYCICWFTYVELSLYLWNEK
jgi:hypothetical protein